VAHYFDGISSNLLHRFWLLVCTLRLIVLQLWLLMSRLLSL